MIPVRQRKTAVGVDFSFDNQYVYWSEISADAISRQFLNGSGYEIVISDGSMSSIVGTVYSFLWWNLINLWWNTSVLMTSQANS